MAYPARQPRSTTALGTLLEDDVAKATGGKRVVGSGSIDVLKGDVKTDFHLIECKTTEAVSYRLQLKTWDKIKGEAEDVGLSPLMVVRFYDRKLGKGRDFIVREVNLEEGISA